MSMWAYVVSLPSYPDDRERSHSTLPVDIDSIRCACVHDRRDRWSSASTFSTAYSCNVDTYPNSIGIDGNNRRPEFYCIWNILRYSRVCK